MTRALSDQAVVITGASSGIGREAALEFGRRGAKVVAVARGREALDEVAAEIGRMGGECLPVVADVAEWPAVEGAASEAVARFGRIDTWVNNAAVSVYATVRQITPEEMRRVVEVNLLGQMHGVKAALSFMGREGTIVNVASALAGRAVPLQSVYSATKHGVKGFTEALRIELGREDSEVRTVLIQPSSINTPLFDHALSKIGVRPMPIPPVYEPGVVAEAILRAAQHPVPVITVGGAGKLLTMMERINPRLVDWYQLQGDRGVQDQTTDEPDRGQNNLFRPAPGPGEVTGRFGEQSKSTSLYTRIFEYHPERKTVAVLAALAGTLVAARRIGR